MLALGTETLDRAAILENEQAIGVDSVAVAVVGPGRATLERAVVGDVDGVVFARRVVDIDGRAVVAGNRRTGGVIDGDRLVAGDAVLAALDQTARIVVDGAAGIILEVDAVAATLGLDVAVVADGGVGAGTDRVGVRRVDQPAGIVGDAD